MGKPDDIPQDAWNGACAAWDQIESDDLRDLVPIARAIVAAVAVEREACGKLARLQSTGIAAATAIRHRDFASSTPNGIVEKEPS